MPNGLTASTPLRRCPSRCPAARSSRRRCRPCRGTARASLRRRRRRRRGGIHAGWWMPVRSCLVVHVVVHTFLVESVRWMGRQPEAGRAQRPQALLHCIMSLPGRVMPSGGSCRGSGLRERGCVRHLLGCSPRCRRVGSRPPATSRFGRRSIVSSWAMNAAVIEDTAPTPMPSPIVTSSCRRTGARLSMTTSAISREALAAGVLRRDGVGVLETGHGDHLVAALLGLQRHLDDRSVDARSSRR